MELTLNEITFLYQVMEVKRVAGFELFPMLEKKEAEEVKESLVDKGIMSDNKMSDYGLTVLRILSLYVKTRIYYKFGEDTVFANYEDNEYIMMRRTKNIYYIEMLSEEVLTAAILSKFKHWERIKDGDYRKRFISKEKFRELMSQNEKAEAMFYYRVDLEAQSEKKATIFLAEGYFQHYDGISGELDMYPREQVQKGIEKIFVREGC